MPRAKAEGISNRPEMCIRDSVKVMQFGEGNFLRAFVDYFYDIANEKAGYNGKVCLLYTSRCV